MSTNKYHTGGSTKGGSATARPKFLSPFREFTEADGFKMASWKDGDHQIRLIPSMTENESPCREVIVVPVNTKDPVTGNKVQGKILAGDWFFKKVQPLLIEKFKPRFNSRANPNGDVILRTQKRIVFFASRVENVPEKGAVKSLIFCNFPGQNYPGAKAGDGDVFIDNTDSGLFGDFDPVNGRLITAKVTSDPQNRQIKQYKFVPSRNPAPMSDYEICLPAAGVPAIASLLRYSSEMEIVEALSHTLPQDVFEAVVEHCGLV